jgi:hypothetical protein
MIEIPTLVDIETRREFLENTVRRMTNGMTYVEVGCWVGGTISLVGQLIKELGIDVKIHGIDNWLCENISPESKQQANCYSEYFDEFIKNLQKAGVDRIVKPLIGESTKFAEQFGNSSIDILFLDGDHCYPHTVNEIRAFLPKMKENSYIFGHDYSSSGGVRQAVLECFGNDISLSSNGASYMKILGKGF